jgi:glutamate synthase domain-containing protein 2
MTKVKFDDHKRSLFEFNRSYHFDEVEPWTEIVKKNSKQAPSYGSISQETTKN